MITECLSAAGITTVVWIDDHFGNPSRDEVAATIRARLQAFKRKGKTRVGVGLFGDVDLRKSESEIDDAADELMEPLPDAELAVAEQDLAKLDESYQPPTTLQSDLTPEQFAELQKAFGPGLKTFGLNEWTSAGVNEFKAASDETLFLIDREFGPGAGISGDDVLGDLVKGTDGFCIMLTHTCPEGGENQRRIDLAGAKKLDAFRFNVVSKIQRGDPDDVDSRFGRAIYGVMTHRFTGEIALAVSGAIQESAVSTAMDLQRQSVFDLDQALFENSNREGVPEFDVVLRIFRIQQREGLSEALREEKLQRRLSVTRRFRQLTSEFRKRWPKVNAEMAKFREWRRLEVLEDGVALNQLHTPLACGDVFESQTEPLRRYIFLGQPCDLMVRDTGDRRSSVALLAQVIEADPAAPLTGGGRYYDIKGVFGAEKMWRVDFQKTTVVNTSVMDWAVFNNDGVVRLTRNHPSPSIALPLGWQSRFEKAKRRIFPRPGVPEAQLIGMGVNVRLLEPTVEADALTYPLRRTGRLDASVATAILAAWASFQARAALDHDFAKPAPTTDDIRACAYFISERKRLAGVAPDSDSDWYQAERELNS